MYERWSPSVAYEFSLNRTVMQILGTWPLQRNLWSNIRWSIFMMMQFAVVANLLMEIVLNCGGTENTMESFLILKSGIHGMINIIVPRYYVEKLMVNLNAAIEDWSTSGNDRVIMKKYARLGRLIGGMELIIGSISCVLFFSSAFLVTPGETDSTSNGTLPTNDFVIPVTCFFENVSQRTYSTITVMQMIEAFGLLLGQLSLDSLFFNMVLHLCGQLEILRAKFTEFGRKSGNNKETEGKLGSLVRRHCRLIEIADNTENVFSICILIQLLMSAILTALSGIRLILSIKRKNSVETLKSLMFMVFYTLQSFQVTYASDCLQSHSESIFHAVYNSAWNEISLTSAKNLMFVMMRSSVPLRITAGKFFYVSRTTMTDILKTSVSYISFLQVAMRDLK